MNKIKGIIESIKSIEAKDFLEVENTIKAQMLTDMKLANSNGRVLRLLKRLHWQIKIEQKR